MFRVTQPTADTLVVYFDFVVNISHSKPGKLSLITPLNEHKSDLNETNVTLFYLKEILLQKMKPSQ